jgi:hypothetical protein
MLVLATPANPGKAAFVNAGLLGGARTQFILRPAGPADPANGVYTTWATAHAAAALADGVKTILVDSAGVPVSVPAGIWDMQNIEIVGLQTGSSPPVVGEQTVQTADGASFTNFWLGLDNILLEHLGTAPLISISAPAFTTIVMRMGTFSTWKASSTAAVLHVIGAGFVSVQVGEGSVIDGVGGTGAFEVVELAVLATCQLNFLGGNTVTSDSFRSPLGATLNISPLGALAINYTQANFAGTLTTFSLGPNLVYVPGGPANWAPPIPTELQDAVDRLATAVFNGLAGPIA